jgi:hypothetical protein
MTSNNCSCSGKTKQRLLIDDNEQRCWVLQAKKWQCGAFSSGCEALSGDGEAAESGGGVDGDAASKLTAESESGTAVVLAAAAEKTAESDSGTYRNI